MVTKTPFSAVERWFSYFPSNYSKISCHVAVRVAALHFAQVIYSQCPDSPEKELALLRIRDVVAMANEAIRLHGEERQEEL